MRKTLVLIWKILSGILKILKAFGLLRSVRFDLKSVQLDLKGVHQLLFLIIFAFIICWYRICYVCTSNVLYKASYIKPLFLFYSNYFYLIKGVNLTTSITFEPFSAAMNRHSCNLVSKRPLMKFLSEYDFLSNCVSTEILQRCCCCPTLVV